MSNVSLSPNRLEFSAEAIPLFVKGLLTGLSMLIYVPAASQTTGLLQYVLSHLRFADGTTAQYTGTPDMLKQPLIGVTAIIWAQILFGNMFSSPVLGILLRVAFGVGQAIFAFQLLKVIFPNILTSNGSRLQFAATQEDYIKWQMVIVAAGVVPSLIVMLLPVGVLMGALISIVVALVTLALYGVAFTLYYRWLASKVQGGSRVPTFNAEPLDFVLRMVGLGLFCMLIVTIPWAMLWFAKWQTSQFSLPARASAAASSF